MSCKVGGRQEADGKDQDGASLDSSEAVGATGGETETERSTRGERFSINKTAGQILASLCKHLHPVPEASSELLLAHYGQLVLWAQPRGGGTVSSHSPGHIPHTMNQVDNVAQACSPRPALCVEWKVGVCTNMEAPVCTVMAMTESRKCGCTCTWGGCAHTLYRE